MSQKIRFTDEEIKARRLPPADLVEFPVNENVDEDTIWLGQEEAIKKLLREIKSIELNDSGCGIRLVGQSGVGKRRTAGKAIEQYVKDSKTEYQDLVVLYNFKERSCPLSMWIPSGYGKKLKSAMSEIIKNAAVEVKRSFEQFKQEYWEIVNKRDKQDLLEWQKEYAAYIKTKGFSLVVDTRSDLYKVYYEKDLMDINQVTGSGGSSIGEIKIAKKRVDKNGNKFWAFKNQLKFFAENGVITPEDAEALEKEFGEMDTWNEQKRLERTQIENEAMEKLEALSTKQSEISKNIIEAIVKTALNANNIDTQANGLDGYIKGAKDALYDNLGFFTASGLTATGQVDPNFEAMKKDFLSAFEVNCMVSSEDLEGQAYFFEKEPNWKNLIGNIEQHPVNSMGYMASTHMDVKPGSLLKMHRRFLIVSFSDIMMHQVVWNKFLISLKNKELEIENQFSQYFPNQSQLQPERIPFNTKVILLCSPREEDMLLEHAGETFKSVFKGRVELGIYTELSDQSIRQLIAFTRLVCKEKKLFPIEKDGMSELIRYASRMAQRNYRVTQDFSAISQIIVSAHQVALESNRNVISKVDVVTAIEKRNERDWQKAVFDSVESGQLKIDVQGEEIGKVNALGFMEDKEGIRYAIPRRATVNVWSRKEFAPINIEKDAKLSGGIYDKWFGMMMASFAGQFGEDMPLAFASSIAFEQGYGYMDGDSATAAIYCAFISAITKKPIKQSIAITGSVLHRGGDVTMVGGINEKIEGFYRVCKYKGFSGVQGVIIPYDNLQELNLSDEVVIAIRDGSFHIFPVKHIDQALEILLGIPVSNEKEQKKTGFHDWIAGRKKNGYKDGTLYAVMQEELKKLAKASQDS